MDDGRDARGLWLDDVARELMGLDADDARYPPALAGMFIGIAMTRACPEWALALLCGMERATGEVPPSYDDIRGFAREHPIAMEVR